MMAFVVKIQNGAGDGAGRARYLFSDPGKVLAISTNVPSPSLLTEDYSGLADDFNRTLLARQQDYRTDHFVVSFQHRFSEPELERIIEIIEAEFQKEFGEDRPYLLVVHAEEFSGKTPEEVLEEKLSLSSACSDSSTIPGTSFHIVLGRNTEGKGIRLGKGEYIAFKRRIAERLQPFANEREREVFQHFLEGKRERSYYKKGELYKPEKNEKVWGKKILKDITTALEKGEVEKAVEILNQHNAEIETFEVSPYNKQKLKEPTPYIIFPRLNGDGMFAMRLRKAERVLYERYKTVFERAMNESERAISKVERSGEKVESIRDEVVRIRRGIGEYIAEHRRAEKRRRKVSSKEKTTERRSLELGKLERVKLEISGIRKELKELERIIEANRQKSESDRTAVVEHGGRPKHPEVDGAGRFRANRHSASVRGMESQAGGSDSSSTIQIGIVDGRAVIADNVKVLERIGAENVQEVSSEEDVARYWEVWRCRGYVEVYLREPMPPWIKRGIEKARWTKKYKPAWSTIERTEEVKPTQIRRERYFEVDDEIVLEKEIVQNPENYINIDGEIGKIAKEALRQREEIEMWWWQEKEKENDNDYGIDL